MANYSTDIRKVAKRTEEEVKMSIEAEKPEILLMGPKLDSTSQGARLRRELAQLCSNCGLTVTLEHPAMEKAGAHSLGKSYNLTHWELWVAKRSQVLIIIPDSPGSFAELGLFSMQPGACRKMIVLFSKEHRGTESYIQRGPRRSAKKLGAAVPFVDYGRVDKAWKKVSSYIQGVKEEMAVSRLLAL